MRYTIRKKLDYSTPQILLYAIDIERGFAMSLENPETDPEQDW